MTATLATALRRLETEERTGVLCAGDGAFHLADGAIVSADCRRTTGLDRLVVESGVATAEDWQLARSGDPGGVLTSPRLESLAVLSVFDAAYFLLSEPVIPEFRPSQPHWLAPVCRVTPHLLVRECARRSDPRHGPWPADLVDRAPVVPVRHVRRNRVALTASEVEVLAAADGRRSIADIARDLGRTTYGCLEAVRTMTAGGLLEHPAEPAARALVPARPAASVANAPALVGPRPLVRRRPRTSGPYESYGPNDGSSSPRTPVPRERSHPQWDPVDRDLLVRLRAALEDFD